MRPHFRKIEGEMQWSGRGKEGRTRRIGQSSCTDREHSEKKRDEERLVCNFQRSILPALQRHV